MVDEKFSWVKTHQQITEFLKTKENSQLELIELLKSIGITPFNDKDKSGKHNIELDEIDPFTFFCYIYKYGSQRRLKYLQEIAKKIGVSIPNDEKGIPSAQAQKVWLFPYKYERKNNEVSRLWSFFNKAVDNQLEDDDFEDVLKIRSTGKTKLTEALFYINPEKYLPINGPTKPYIKEELCIDPKFNTYSEYIKILEEIKAKISMPFYELSYEAWKWNTTRQKVNYWIFQGNPKIFDFETALRQNILTDWTVSAHKDVINTGDKVIFWITGDKSGCYALGEITSKPHVKRPSPDDHLWKGKDKSELKADIKITRNLVDAPILKEHIDKTEELSELNVGNQGTNFSATEDEYLILLKMADNMNKRKYWLYAPGRNASMWEEFYSEGIMGLGWDALGDLNQYNTKEDIVKRLQKIENTKGSKKNDATANFEFKEVLSKGDIVIAKKGRKEYIGYGIVTSDYYYDKNKETFQKCRKIDWKKKGIWEAEKSDIVLKTLTDVTKYPDYVDKLIKLIGIEIKEENNMKSKLNIPLNVILYGPPGTGKTYELKNTYMPLFTSQQNSITRAEYLKSIIQDCAWWQVIALSVLELGKTKVADIFKHEYVQIKASLSNSTTVTPTIWGQLQNHTIESCEHVNVQKRMPPFIFNKTSDSKWEILKDEINDQTPELLSIKEKIYDYQNMKDVEIKRYTFLTFHQSYSYEDFIEGIKPNVSPDSNEISYNIEEGVFLKMCNKARNDLINNYAIFIDEINRGNIASIFGELITCIEEDKREGNSNSVEVTLPYSQNNFLVPPNLFVIGTMNTADRSVETLDTALRRRFAFIEMNPQPEKLVEPEYKCDGIELDKLLTTINARIERLLDKDYCIGHSYFMTIQNRSDPLGEIKHIFSNKILPLLQEYFYGDWGKIMLVLGKGFVNKKTIPAGFLNRDDYDDTEEYEEKPVYCFTNSSDWTLETFKAIYE